MGVIKTKGEEIIPTGIYERSQAEKERLRDMLHNLKPQRIKAQTGKKFTPEHRSKISESLRGRRIPHKGHPISDSTRAKISESNLREDAGYFAIHAWLKNRVGAATYCIISAIRQTVRKE